MLYFFSETPSLPVNVRSFDVDVHNVKYPLYARDKVYIPISLNIWLKQPYFIIELDSAMAVEHILFQIECSLCPDNKVLMKPIKYRRRADRKFQATNTQESFSQKYVSMILRYIECI